MIDEFKYLYAIRKQNRTINNGLWMHSGPTYCVTGPVFFLNTSAIDIMSLICIVFLWYFNFRSKCPHLMDRECGCKIDSSP